MKRPRRRIIQTSFWHLVVRTGHLLIDPRRWVVGRLLPAHRPIHVHAIDQWLVDRLPCTCETINGWAMEPMTLVFIGERRDLLAAFRRAGWLGSVPLNPLSWVQGALALMRDWRFPRGPMTPLFIGDSMQELDFQKESHTPSFRRRHHLRVWRTRYVDHANRPIWVAGASYEYGWRRMKVPPFVTHKSTEFLDKERELVTAELQQVGCQLMGHYQLMDNYSLVSAYGDTYATDGQAIVLEFPRVTP